MIINALFASALLKRMSHYVTDIRNELLDHAKYVKFCKMRQNVVNKVHFPLVISNI